MGVGQNHALGRSKKFFATVESTFGTPVEPSATEAVKCLEFNVDAGQERMDREDNRSSRSLLERITGKKSVSWTYKGYLIPSGSAGTAPDAQDLFQAGLGTEAVSGGVSVTYSENATQSGLQSLTLHSHSDEVLQTGCRGAFVDKTKMIANSGDPFMVEFSGRAQHEIWTGRTTLTSSPAGVDNFTVADPDALSVGSIVSVNGSGAYMVTAISGSTITCTGETISGTSGQTVAPAAPSETTAGSPIAGITGSLTIDGGSAVPITAFEVEIDNGIKALDDHAFSAVIDDYIPGLRKITGKIAFRARQDLVTYLVNSRDFASKALIVTLGSTAGSICTVNIPYAEFDFGKVTIPQSEEVVVEIPFVGKGSSGEDAITIVFT